MAALDRYGEPVDDDSSTDATTSAHDLTCRGGWLGEDDDGRLVPCLSCRPHLARRRGDLNVLLGGPHARNTARPTHRNPHETRTR